MNGIMACFTGRIGKDAEVRTTRDGKPWASFPVAVDTQKDSEAATAWVRVSVFGDRVDELAPRLVKGVEVYCEGRLSVRPWVDANGKERSGLNLATNSVTVMGQIGKRLGVKETTDLSSPRPVAQTKAKREELDDAIPF
jgi:single-strand DNA-binding protein